MDTVHECDGQTDGRTDRITITKTVQRRASHGKNVSITVQGTQITCLDQPTTVGHCQTLTHRPCCNGGGRGGYLTATAC